MAAGVPQQLWIRDRGIANRQLASTHAALFGALPVEAVIAPLRGDKQREQEPTNDAVPVAGRDRILVFAGLCPLRVLFFFCSPTLNSFSKPFSTPSYF